MESSTKWVILLAFLGFALAGPTTNNHSEESDSDELLESMVDIPVDTCRRGCPRILDPICAVDEFDDQNVKYFHNQCLMEYDGCRKGRVWKPTQMLQCITNVDPLVRADCLRACPFIYDPVCGADGEYFQIFGNRCIFAMENCLASGKWLEVRSEVCGLKSMDE